MAKDKSEVVLDGKAVFYAVLYESFRKAALDCGYALAIHGSMARDMDLLAAPWVEDALPVATLVSRISDCIGETTWKQYHLMKWQEKPHGRVSYTLSISGDWTIDLSIIKPSQQTLNRITQADKIKKP